MANDRAWRDEPLSDAGDMPTPSSHSQRARVAQALLALSLLLAGVAAMHAGAWLGTVDRDGLWAWTIVSVVGFSIPLVLIQTRVTEKLHDPSLTLPQMLLASTVAAWAYTLAGTSHAVVTLMQALALSFGIFGIDSRPAIYCAAYSILIFAVTMVRQCLVDPVRYQPADDLLLFIFLVLIVVGIVINTLRVNRMRERIQTQKQDLQKALARIEQLATLDELTGLPNRRFLQQALDAEGLRSQRSQAPWCVALIDLDNFKRINDTHGHATGDAVLKWFAAQAKTFMRASDIVGRWGGEEFVVLMPATSLHDGVNGLQRLKAMLEAQPSSPPPEGLTITFSAGVAQHAKGDAVAHTLELADQLCYAAKRNGRNRIEK